MIAKWQLNIFGMICLSIGLVAGSYFTLKGIVSIFATTTASITKNTDTHFSQGTLSSTTVSGSGTAGLVQLSTGANYKKTLTIDNSANGNTLTNYQVLLDEGEVGYWKMDEASGSTVADASGNSNTGTATGTTVTSSGHLNSGRSYNGTSSDRIAVSSSNSLSSFTTKLSVSIWAKPTVVETGNVERSLISKRNTTYSDHQFRWLPQDEQKMKFCHCCSNTQRMV